MFEPLTALDRLRREGKAPQYRGDEPRSFLDRQKEAEHDALKGKIEAVAIEQGIIRPCDATAPPPPAKRQMPKTLEAALRMVADPVGDGIRRTFSIEN